MSQHVRFITLGCRVNQYETQGMRESLETIGVREFSRQSTQEISPPTTDFIVINTCTVTKAADRESRYWIRRARREYPEAKIIVAGCYVEKNRKQIEEIPEVDLVLDNQEKNEIASRIMVGCATPQVQDESGLREKRKTYSSLGVSRSEGRTRAYVKVQDGCNHACSFCKVVMVRGRSRSRSLSEIVEEVRRLGHEGHREIVFAGIQLGGLWVRFEREWSVARNFKSLFSH